MNIGARSSVFTAKNAGLNHFDMANLADNARARRQLDEAAAAFCDGFCQRFLDKKM